MRSAEIRRLVVQQSRRAGVGHIGSALSVADIIAVLYSGVLQGVGSEDADRDRFILSKGHAALALYAALHLRGFLDTGALNTYCADDSLLGVHPDHRLQGVDLSTGALGHGLSVGAGSALGARLQGSNSRTYVLLSDAELNEGSVWEAVMFAGHHRIDNLVAIVDANGQQALGVTKEVLDLQPIAAKFRAFGWHAGEVDGHDEAALRQRFRASSQVSGAPQVLVARTVAGRGVSFMEGRVEWHYLPLNDAQYQQALQELAA